MKYQFESFWKRRPKWLRARSGDRRLQTPMSTFLGLTQLLNSRSFNTMASVSEIPDEPGQPPALSALALAETSQAKEQIITPFDVSGGVDEHGRAIAIDYNRLVDKFGCQRIDEKLLQRFERLTGKPPHRLLRRGIVFSHRDLTLILDKYEKGLPFYLYTGRGPSSDSMHVGHSIPFEFTKYVGFRPFSM